MARIERATSPLPRECSTTELHGRLQAKFPPNFRQLRIAQNNFSPNAAKFSHFYNACSLERVKGIEPSS